MAQCSIDTMLTADIFSSSTLLTFHSIVRLATLKNPAELNSDLEHYSYPKSPKVNHLGLQMLVFVR